MADQPFISIRKHIKWEDAEAGEDTDTLVLTSRKKYFVDVRLYLPTSPNEASLPSTTALPISRLEWGFAGTATSTSAEHSDDEPPKLLKPAHTEWTHWVDNKTTDEVKDEGDMYPQPNGDVLELGAMVNPGTGKMEKYEEVWVDLDAEVASGDKGKVCWVLRTEDKVEGVRGMIIRIGQFVQGVVRKGEEISIGRFKWEKQNGWHTLASMGSVHLAEYVHISAPEENDTIHGKDRSKWVCMESFIWK